MNEMRIDKNLDKILRKYLDEKPTFLSVIRAREASLFNSFVPYAPKVLDFGCGDGFFTKISLIGCEQKIDIGLETDSERAVKARKSSVYKEVLVYDGRKIPLSSSSISVVISNSVMEHLSDLEMSLVEIHRILIKRGIFYVSVMTDKYEDNLLGKIFLGDIYLKWMRKRAYHKNLLSKNEWEKLFIKSGFKIKNRYAYLDRQSTRLLDLLQYLSIPGILTQNNLAFLSRIYFILMRFIFEEIIRNRIKNESHNQNCSAYFLVLMK